MREALRDPWTYLCGLIVLWAVVMYLLLTRVSGVPPLEQAMLRSRGEAYRAYQARVSGFFPRPRKFRSNARIGWLESGFIKRKR